MDDPSVYAAAYAGIGCLFILVVTFLVIAAVWVGSTYEDPDR